MNELAAEVQAVADELTAAGIPATTDPGMVLQLLAAHPAAALVIAPEELRLSVGMAAIDLDVQVQLLTPGPDDLAAADRLYTAVVAAAATAVPIQFVLREMRTVGEVDLPALTWTTPRRVPYPQT